METKSQLTQKAAVKKFIQEEVVTTPNEDGTPGKLELTKEIKKKVKEKLFLGFRSGDIKLTKTYDDAKLKKYCSGLVSNWLKKDETLN